MGVRRAVVDLMDIKAMTHVPAMVRTARRPERPRGGGCGQRGEPVLEAPETELKFAITEAGIAALCKHPVFATPGGSDTLRSVYFDTPARDLRRKAFSLRVREVDGGFVQTLKRKGGASPVVRREWETEV